MFIILPQLFDFIWGITNCINFSVGSIFNSKALFKSLISVPSTPSLFTEPPTLFTNISIGPNLLLISSVKVFRDDIFVISDCIAID